MGASIRRALVALVVISAVSGAAAGVADAQELAPQPELSVYYNNITAARFNPLGLVDFFDVTLRLRLFESESDIAKQNFVGLGVAGGFSPAWARVGAIAIVQPLTVLQLYARYLFVGYFSSFNLFSSFDSADTDFSDTSVENRAEDPATPNYATYGAEFAAGARVQLKVGPIAMRNNFRAVFASMNMERANDVVFYDQIYDMLVPNDGWMVINDLDLLYVSDFGLVVAARWTYSHAFYNDGHFAGGVTPGIVPNNDVHRVGPLIAYIFDDNPGGMIDKPTVLLLAQWHLVHRWRTGADVSTAVPYIGLGFKFEGDLMSDH